MTAFRTSAMDPELDPWRCSKCDRPTMRSGGPAMACVIHGTIMEPYYDDGRAHRLAWSIPFGDGGDGDD